MSDFTTQPWYGQKVDAFDESVPEWYRAGFPGPPAPEGSSAPVSAPQTTVGPSAGSSTATTGTPGVFGTTSNDAWDAMRELFAAYKIPDLENIITDAITQGWDSVQTTSHIRQSAGYKQRFAGNIQREQAGLQPLAEKDYLAVEDGYQQAAAHVGLPASFYDQPSDFADLIGKDVSAAEYKDRLVNGYQAALMSDHPTKQALQSMYGLTDGDLAAYWLDPTKAEAVLTKQFTAGQIGGVANRTGFGTLSRTQAEDLASQGLTADQTAAGFTSLAHQQELMNALPGQQGQAISQDEQLSAAFGGNAAAQDKIKNVAATRLAEFGGGGGYTQSNGTTGIGTAR